ncbi:hypothetical protein F5Y05DRAFT_409362 [Hypoxylon sp. FL0543]|nr:hypothetical protein F5Y05DRAFT_409362 [Hypoxylon sp. FL0543]
MDPLDDVLCERDPNVAMGLNDTSDLILSMLMQSHDARPTRLTPACVSTHPISPNATMQTLPGWFAYPPQPVSAPEQEPFKRTPEGLRDIGEFTAQYLKQSTAFQEWMEEVKQSRESLGSERRDRKVALLRAYRRIAVEAPDVASRATAKFKAMLVQTVPIRKEEDLEKDRVLLAQLHQT